MHTINNYVTKEYIGKAESIISKWQKTSLAHTCTQTYTNEEKKEKREKEFRKEEVEEEPSQT